MIRSRSYRHQLRRDHARPRAVSWLAAILVLMASTAFAIRPTSGVLAAIQDLEHPRLEMTCAYAGHAHHDHHGTSQHDHAGHCVFCFAPAMVSGSFDLVRLPAPAFERTAGQPVLEFVHVALERSNNVQSRAPPVS